MLGWRKPRCYRCCRLLLLVGGDDRLVWNMDDEVLQPGGGWKMGGWGGGGPGAQCSSGS